MGIRPDEPGKELSGVDNFQDVIARRIHAKIANPCYSQAVHTTKDLGISDCKCIKVRSIQITASMRSSVITEQKYSLEAILLSQGLRNVSTQTVKNEFKTSSL